MFLHILKVLHRPVYDLADNFASLDRVVAVSDSDEVVLAVVGQEVDLYPWL
jgi:hypothetical protein